jgi:cyclic pyranopterin phosphate synthase
MTATRQLGRIALRLSVTDRCPMRCLYCLPPEGVPLVAHADVLRFEEMAALVRVLRRHWGLAKVHLTGGEPLIRRGIADLVARLAAERPADLALTTCGVRLASLAADLRRAGLWRVNVSLDSLDPETYRTLTRGGDLAETLDGIAAARRAGLEPVKLNMVVLRGVNDGEVVRVARWGLARGCPVRFLEVMPIHVAAARHGEWFVPSAEVRGRLAAAFDLVPLASRPGASAREYRARDASGLAGRIGFISPCSEPFCAGCRRLRLTATGRLLGCLARADATDVRPFLKQLAAGDSHGAEGEAPLVAAVEEALRRKRFAPGAAGPQAPRPFADQCSMAGIGG